MVERIGHNVLLDQMINEKKPFSPSFFFISKVLATKLEDISFSYDDAHPRNPYNTCKNLVWIKRGL